MQLMLTALGSAVVICAVSCAAGTGPPDLGGSSTGGEGGSAGRTVHSGELAPPPAPGAEVEGSYSLDVACADVPVIDVCLLSSHADEDVTFTLPAGTKRSSIAYTVTPHGPSAGGTVDFAGTDPLDGTVHLHGFADAFSSVHIQVTGVMVVPE